MEEKFYLFSYGTLKNKEIQEILLDMAVPMEEAVLPDWRVYEDSDHYYFIKQETGHQVKGFILELTKEQCWIIDQWEEIPCYSRVKARAVMSDSQPKEVFVYIRPESAGIPALEAGMSGHSSELDLKTAQEFRKGLEFPNRLPFTDLYILIPCATEGELASSATAPEFAKTFLYQYAETTQEEFNPQFLQSLERTFLDFVDLSVRVEDKKKGEIIYSEKQACPVYMTWHKDTGFVVVTIAVPAAMLSAFYLLEVLNAGKLIVSDRFGDEEMLLQDWLESKGLTVHGKARTAVFSQMEIQETDRLKLVTSESSMIGNVTESRFHEMIQTNLGQYDSAKIFCSDSTLFEISADFEDNYTERIDNQILTLFVIELLLFQDAAISKVDSSIDREIHAQLHDPHRKNSLDVIEELVSESTRTLMFWNPKNFIYPAAESLANRISAAFGIEKMLSIQEKNKGKLEQLINIHYVKMSEKETKNTNALLLILAMIQVIPTFYLIFTAMFNKTLQISNYLSAVISLLSVIFIYLLFQRNNTKRRIILFSRRQE